MNFWLLQWLVNFFMIIIIVNAFYYYSNIYFSVLLGTQTTVRESCFKDQVQAAYPQVTEDSNLTM